MTTKKSDTSFLLRFPFHRLEATIDGVTITKNKAILNRKFALTFLLIALGVGIFWTLPKKSSNGFQKGIDLTEILVLIGFALFIGVTVFLSFRRLKKLVSNFRLAKQGGDLYLNNVVIARSNQSEQATIIIQDVGANGGVGGSKTVGVSVGKRFWGLCFELDDTDAAKAATFLSKHLGLPVNQREAAAFPLFNQH
jgi:hypothetical protein